MRKILSYFAISTIISSSIIPVSACVFNRYIDRATDAAVENFANQTSSIVKSLVLGKEKNVDTAQTINDIFSNISKVSNPTINNLTNEKGFTYLDDFVKSWGENSKIDFGGFDPSVDKYFVANGQGALTKQVNTYNKINSTLSSLGLAKNLAIATNTIIYNQVNSNPQVRKTIFDFLSDAKKSQPTQKAAKLLKDTVLGNDWSNPNPDTFKNDIVDPASFLLDYLVDNKWSATQAGTTPTTGDEFNEFMTNWKDSQGGFYSEWHGGLLSTFYDEWDQTNYNFYRSGALLNWLIYRIGKDYQIKKPGESSYKDRYLGEIISEYIDIFHKPVFDVDKLLKDLDQYWDHIIENPLYIITLVQVLIPIIKYFILDGDAYHGTKNLTLGKIYPSDKEKESYNFSDIINEIKLLITNPDKLKTIVKTLMGWDDYKVPGQSFLYDVRVHYGLALPFGEIMKHDFPVSEDTKKGLIKQVVDKITKPNIINIVNTVSNTYDKWIKNYDDKNQGFDMSLSALRDFLTGTNNGLLQVINQDLVLGALFPILKDNPDTPLSEDEYKKFYTGLGVQLPDSQGNVPENFRTNSVLDILKNNLNTADTPLQQISNILFGNSNTEMPGIFDTIEDANKQWIENNYTTFFDPNNQKIGSTFNRVMTTKIENNVIISNLQYNFSFKINDKTYKFLIKCISHDDAASFKGTKTFRFTDIDLLR